ncbi:DUF2214 family protein [Fodinibius roseus]|nr:DUF2214 family protein [Fodinibius roseus]
MSYSIFYWVHIVSYIAWLFALAASLFLASKVRAEKNDRRKQLYMKWERLATDTGAHLGAIGILISGAAMASLPVGPRWGWFNVQLYPWLALKQGFFILILVLVVLSMRRSSAFRKALKREREEKERTNDTIRKRWSSAYRMSLLVYLLVVINTFLGLVKPYLLG